MANWDRLPAETRLAILEMVIHTVKDTTLLGRTHARKVLAYTSVCREWQAFFEEKHFKEILLSPERLSDFDRIVRGSRRNLVKHITLWVELNPDMCEDCGLADLFSFEDSNDRAFADTMQKLFIILNDWERPRDLNREGLTLELRLYCPFFCKQQNIVYGQGAEPRFVPRNIQQPHWRCEGLRLPMNLEEGIVDNSDPRRSRYLPRVDVVTTFLLRRTHTGRIIPESMSQILSSLTGLECLIYEPEPEQDMTLQARRDERFLHPIEAALPRTLKQLTIFEDSEIDAVFGLHRGSEPGVNSLELGLAIARASQTLEHLSASYIIDAKDFFQPFWPRSTASTGWTWDKLNTIALTSHFLNPDQPPKQTNDLFEAASIAARHMPNLGIMEIWNGRRGQHSCIFRFKNEGIASTITWHSSWELEVEQRVIQSWTETVQQNRGYVDLSVVFMEMPTDNTKFPACVLRHLELKDRILHPASFSQIQSYCTVADNSQDTSDGN
ncbi:hypothetical protein F4677DRAFT_449837 [Hypoxylon crocopeplum]|nr:hypothetical protein F4677DRAFT_449837 [Hypoxylon crocopeplum]